MIDRNQFNGIEEIETTFRSWQWIYGKTPRFIVSRDFYWKNKSFSVEIHVFHGIIEKLNITEFKSNIDLKGIQFTTESVSKHFKQILSETQNNFEFENYLNNCIFECIEGTL